MRAALHMALDGSDDTAQQHHCVLDQSVKRFLSPWTASSLSVAILSYTISERDYGFVSLFNVISLYPNELMNLATFSLCPGFFDSLLQNYAARDFLISVLLKRNARH